MSDKKILAIQVRGTVDAPRKIENTLQQLNLGKRNQAAILKDNDANRGMLNKVKDYITYGTYNDKTEELLETKTENFEPGTQINLTPPSGGFQNTKTNVKQGGSLGKRGNINKILQKMA